MNRLPVLGAAAVSAALCACASEGQPAEALRPNAVRFAQQQGAADLGCSAATAQVVAEQTIEEPVTTGGYTPPYRAEYTVRVSGCGKNTMYSVRCNRAKSCIARPVQAAAPPPRQFADELQPGAVQVARERGAAELECPAAAAQVLRQNTIEEPVTTGMYTPPYRAEYTVSVSGCGKGATYSVTCDDHRNRCVTGTFQDKARE